MNELGHNGSSEGASTLPPDPHDEFVELCAVSTTGELTAEEWARLEEHLSHCATCRESQRSFERLIALTIPALSVEEGLPEHRGNATGSWSASEAEAKLMAALSDEPSDTAGPAPQPSLSILGTVGRYGIAAILLLGAGMGGYRLGILHGKQTNSTMASIPSSVSNATARQKPAETPEPSVKAKVASDADAVTKLRDQLELEQTENAHLMGLQSQKQTELDARDADLKNSAQGRADLEQRLAALQESAKSLQARLDQINDQKPQDTAQFPSLKAQITDLNAELQAKNKEIAEQQELLQHDRDIRDLVGARNLYIAEIYDVAKNGDTQKPFGRVFYTKDRSLVFYGYDLNQQAGVKSTSAFQAWGRRGADQQHDVSLGLLYQDDAGQKRWVLKLNDPKMIAQLDAVFVTVEPAGGSSKPSGKPLLFTYLHIDPNHP